MNRDIIIACDFSSTAQTISFLNRFGNERPYVKIGMELFYAEGPAIVRALKARGHRIILDLKLHDIPTAVKKTMRVLSELGADMINLHAGGGRAMMEAALEGLKGFSGPRPLLIGVTMLTSTSPESMRDELYIERPLPEVVIGYAKNCKDSGLDGVVCSPLEAAVVHTACGNGFLTVTPGIRFAEESAGDQVRVMDPAGAREAGSDFIVVGRSITQADDPAAAWRRCKRDFLEQGV